MKPVSLIRRIILNSTKIGDVVFDSFGGSGTCLIACEQTKRKCLIIEIDPGYCETIIERFEKYSGIKAKKLN
jgi:site-specific DNA-methyltransferase (adenine-specific)